MDHHAQGVRRGRRLRSIVGRQRKGEGHEAFGRGRGRGSRATAASRASRGTAQATQAGRAPGAADSRAATRTHRSTGTGSCKSSMPAASSRNRPGAPAGGSRTVKTLAIGRDAAQRAPVTAASSVAGAARRAHSAQRPSGTGPRRRRGGGIDAVPGREDRVHGYAAFGHTAVRDGEGESRSSVEGNTGRDRPPWRPGVGSWEHDEAAGAEATANARAPRREDARGMPGLTTA